MRRVNPPILLPILFGLMVCLAGACKPGVDHRSADNESDAEPMGSKQRVILILLDAARADRFSCYGYSRPTTPEIDRLARNGFIFLNHFAQATGTRESVPSMLFSRYFTPPLFPDNPQVPYAAPDELFRRPDSEQISLPKAFESAGFVTAAISAHLWIGEGTTFAGEFQELRDLTRNHRDEQYPYPRAREVVDDTIGWINRHRERDFFLYIHLMDTHYPHYFEEEAQSIFGAATYDASRFSASGSPLVPGLTTRDLDYADALYDGSLRYTDDQLGRLFEYLRQTGLGENTTVAITSDHGEYLRDAKGGRPRPDKVIFTHGGEGLDPLLRIPLVLHSPSTLDHGCYEGLSEGVDLGPTLLRCAGINLPESKVFDGIDLVDRVHGKTPEKQQVVMRQTVRTASHKAIFTNYDRRLLGNRTPKETSLAGQLYDLIGDPWEVTNIFDDQPEIVADMLRRYRDVLRAPYLRAQSARNGDQPVAGFAISANHLRTDTRLTRVRGENVAPGWSLMPGEQHNALIAFRTDEPLNVRLPIPDGDYQLSVGLVGRAVLEINGQEGEVVSNPNAPVTWGIVTVADEVFHVRITPRGDFRLFFFGFVPAGVDGGSAEDLEKLRSLGYVE